MVGMNNAAYVIYGLRFFPVKSHFRALCQLARMFAHRGIDETGCFMALIRQKPEPRPFLLLHLRAGAQCRAEKPRADALLCACDPNGVITRHYTCICVPCWKMRLLCGLFACVVVMTRAMTLQQKMNMKEKMAGCIFSPFYMQFWKKEMLVVLFLRLRKRRMTYRDGVEM